MRRLIDVKDYLPGLGARKTQEMSIGSLCYGNRTKFSFTRQEKQFANLSKGEKTLWGKQVDSDARSFGAPKLQETNDKLAKLRQRPLRELTPTLTWKVSKKLWNRRLISRLVASCAIHSLRGTPWKSSRFILGIVSNAGNMVVVVACKTGRQTRADQIRSDQICTTQTRQPSGTSRSAHISVTSPTDAVEFPRATAEVLENRYPAHVCCVIDCTAPETSRYLSPKYDQPRTQPAQSPRHAVIATM